MIIRIDKALSDMKNITRRDAKAFITSGRVKINGNKVKSSNDKYNTETDLLEIDNEEIVYSEFVYIMMNKPKGVISSSDGKGEKTVIDILPEDMKRKNLFPCGRLDKDTTGFMLITDDGAFAHSILSPKNHVEKTYVATLSKPVDEKVIEDFKNGMELNGEKLMKASLVSLNDENTIAKVVIKQGIYHQIKRMFKKHGIEVVELERTKIGELYLDASLKVGECRYINKNEINLIKMDKH